MCKHRARWAVYVLVTGSCLTLNPATLLISGGNATYAQDAAAEKPATGKFDTMFAEWRQLLQQMRDLQRDYKTAKPDERSGLVTQFNDLVKKGETMLPQLKQAAVDTYQATPENSDVADFLAASAAGELKRDNYEEALRLSKMLIDHDYPNPSVYEAAGIAAFETTSLDDAEEFLEIADEKDTIRSKGRDYLTQIPEYREYWKVEKELRDKEAALADDDPKALPRVKLETSKGDITVELFENEAPNTVANFVSLVEQGFYDDKNFHRVLEGFMAQGGCPKGDGTGGPGYRIKCECYEPNFRRHFRGTLSMAHAGRDTGGSQFFLTFRPTGSLDGKHTAFGRVIDGMEVLSELQRRDPQQENQPEPDKIVKATVVRKRDHAYEPAKVGDPESTPETPKPDTKPSDDKPATEKPATEKPAAEKPAAEKPADEKPAAEKPAAEKPADEKPAAEKPAAEKPAAEKPAEEKPATEKPADEKPKE